MTYKFSVRSSIVLALIKKQYLHLQLLSLPRHILASVPGKRAGIHHMDWPFIRQCKSTSALKSQACRYKGWPCQSALVTSLQEATCADAIQFRLQKPLLVVLGRDSG